MHGITGFVTSNLTHDTSLHVLYVNVSQLLLQQYASNTIVTSYVLEEEHSKNLYHLKELKQQIEMFKLRPV